MNTVVPHPVRGAPLVPIVGSNGEEGPWARVALLDCDRQSLHNLNLSINKKESVTCRFSAPGSHSKYLVKFLPQFKSPIIKCFIANKPLFGCVDSGAQGLLLTHHCAQEIYGPNLSHVLSPYKGPQYLDAQHNTMSIKGTVKNQLLKLGTLSIKVDIFVYETKGAFKEALLGFDILKTNNIAICPKGLKVCDTLEEEEEKVVNCNRLSPPHCAYFPLKCNHPVSLQGGQSSIINVSVDCSSFKGKLNELSNMMLICHSEDLQNTSSPHDLFIYYQYVWTGESGDLALVYKNTSSQDMNLVKNQLVGHAEQMYTPSNAYVTNMENKCEFFKICNRLLKSDEQTYISQDIEDLMSQQELGPRSIKPLLDKQINCQSQNPEHKQFLNKLLKSVEPLFGTHPWDVATICGSAIDFKVKPGTVPIAQRPYRIPVSLEPKARKLMNRLIELNLVRPSVSKWASNVIVLKKRAAEKPTNKQTDVALQQCDDTESVKTNKLRFVFDNREINKVLLPVRSYPLSTIQDIMQQIQGAALLGAIDMVQGFWGHGLQDSSAALFAFNWCGTLLEPRKLTQGVCFAPQLYQQKLHNLMVVNGLAQYDKPRVREIIVGSDPSLPPTNTPTKAPSSPPVKPIFHQSGVSVYLDNLIIHASDVVTYKTLLSKVLNILLKNNYKVKLEKSHFFLFKECILFGFHFSIEENSIRPEQSKIDKILNIPRPTSRVQLKSFIGLVSFYQSLCPKFQHIAAPLSALTSASVTFRWSDEAQQSFEALKNIIATKPLCYLFNKALPVVVYSDGCVRQYVAHSCYQYDEKLKQLVPLLHYSKKLNKSQSHFSQHLCELYSLLVFVTKQQHLIYGSQVYLMTDCISLSFAVRYAGINSTVCRWLSIIKAQNLKIFHLPAENAILHLTDLLTRNDNKLTKVNRKLSQADAVKLPILDFFQLPPMTLSQVEDICSRFYEWYDKIKGNQKSPIQEAKFCYPTPDICVQVTPTSVYHYCARTHLLSIGKHPQLQVHGTLAYARTIEQLKAKLAFYFPALSVAKLIQLQGQDTYIKAIIGKLDVQEQVRFVMLSGLLCKTRQTQSQEALQLVLPSSLALPLIKQVHEKLNTFHLGFPKLAAEIKKVFVIKDLASLFQKVVTECVFCNYNIKPNNQKLKPGLGILLGPRMAICFDVCELHSKWGKGAFLCIVDPFSLFCVASSITKPVTAEAVVQIISRDWIRLFGVVPFAVKDNEKAMTSSLIDNVLRLLRIQPIYICPLNSTSNSHAERLNNWLTKIMACLHQQIKLDNKYMDIYLSFACLAWNSSVNIFHGHSPALLHTGFQPRVHNFVLLSNLQSKLPVPALIRHFKSLYELLFLIYKKKQLEYEKKREKEGHIIKKQPFEVGDCCLKLQSTHNLEGRPGWKLRERYSKDIFKVVKVGKVNCHLLPWSKQLLFQSREKGRGKVFKIQISVCHKNKLKKVSDPFALLYKNSAEQINRLARDMNNLKPAFKATLGHLAPINKPKAARSLCDFFATVLQSSAGAQLKGSTRILLANNLKNWSGLFAPTKPFKAQHVPSHSGLFTLKSCLGIVQSPPWVGRDDMYYSSRESEAAQFTPSPPSLSSNSDLNNCWKPEQAWQDSPQLRNRQQLKRNIYYNTLWSKVKKDDDSCSTVTDSYVFQPTEQLVSQINGSFITLKKNSVHARKERSPSFFSPIPSENGSLGKDDRLEGEGQGGQVTPVTPTHPPTPRPPVTTPPTGRHVDSFHSVNSNSASDDFSHHSEEQGTEHRFSGSSDDLTIIEKNLQRDEISIVEKNSQSDHITIVETNLQLIKPNLQPVIKGIIRDQVPKPGPSLETGQGVEEEGQLARLPLDTPRGRPPSSRTSSRGRIILSPLHQQRALSDRLQKASIITSTKKSKKKE